MQGSLAAIRRRLHDLGNPYGSNFAGYAAKTTRVIPVVRLRRA